jgi:cysteine desulfurase
MAIRGAAEAAEATGRRHLVASAIEHEAVLNTLKALSRRGWRTTLVPVDQSGIVSPDRVREALADDTALVSVMHANNEIGTIQPIADLYERARAQGALLVCDAVQAAGKMPIAEADLIAISAHKFHGPKGIGALWVRDGVELEPHTTGGGQEGGLRSGTLSPALCAGMGAAAEVARARMAEDASHVSALWRCARELFAGWQLNGSADHRYRGNLNLRRDGVHVARLMSDAREVMFSAGSACASESGKPSRILAALGLSPDQARGSIRLGFGRYTTPEQLERAAELINNAAAQQE